jgi:hypothetical protein
MNHAIADETFTWMNCMTFAGHWFENYKVCELYYGFGYGNPLGAIIPWRDCKDLSERQYRRLSANNDKAAFSEADYFGPAGSTWIIFLTNLDHVIRLIDWARQCTAQPRIREQAVELITGLQGVEVRPLDAVRQMCTLVDARSEVMDAENKNVIDSMIFPFNFWWQKSCGARVNDFQIAALQEAWNVIIDRVERSQFLFTPGRPETPEDRA